jgi:hypothetical protein
MKVEFAAFPKAFTGNVAAFVAADKQLADSTTWPHSDALTREQLAARMVRSWSSNARNVAIIRFEEFVNDQVDLPPGMACR